MGSLSLAHWIVVAAVLTLLFGAGRIPKIMGDAAKGVKAWKTGLAEVEKVAESAEEVNPSPVLKKLGM